MWRRALSLLEVAVREKKNGNNIAIVKDGKIVKEIIFPLA